ncbi:MAG TPA: hypothetical protein DCR93_16435 [Cytophagales bacterium]|nr:hypothetical protein [Cytophagales bacterium]HAP61012.1 hypothetical protein [Cytophagales bacterium]
MVEKAMQGWYKKPLAYNDSLPILLPNVAEPIDTTFNWFVNQDDYYIIRQVDASCSKCIGQMEVAQAFLEKHSEVKNLHFIMIVNAVIPDMAQEAIDKLQLDFPVLFQRNHEQFRRMNQLPINDDLFTNVLVNGRGEIILFGDALFNELTEELFLSIAKGECGV